MVVVHVASDAFVGTVPQVVTVNVNLIVACCNLFRCNGFCVLTRYHYCGNHSYCDRGVALAFRHIQWHNIIDRCVGCHVAVGHGIGGIDIPAKMGRLAKSLLQE